MTDMTDMTDDEIEKLKEQVKAPQSVIGFHGCTVEAADEILRTGDFKWSEQEYDWLGAGFYFWEWAPTRGAEWAAQVARRAGKIPAVLVATIELGRCANLLDTEHFAGLEEAYRTIVKKFEDAGEAVPENNSRGGHYLDQDVVDAYCDAIADTDAGAFQTVRGCFPEGKPIYAGSKLLSKTHVQIAVRDPGCITNVQRVL